MMALIKEWIITIISVIIFATFMEILIPNSDYKRYVNVVIGFLFVIVILTPLTKFIGGEIDLKGEILKTSNQLELSTSQDRINNIQHSNEETILILYKNKISKQIKNHIEHATEYIVSEVIPEVENNSKSTEFGSIKGVSIILGKKIRNTEHISGIVEPVQINISMDRKNNNTVEADGIFISNEDDIIKKSISNLYNIPKDNINIYIPKDDQAGGNRYETK